MNNQLLKQVTCFQMYRVKSQFKCEKHNSIIYTIICMHTFLKYSIIGLCFMLCPLQLKTNSLWDIITFAYFSVPAATLVTIFVPSLSFLFQISVMIVLLCCSLQWKAKMAFDISSVVPDAVSYMSGWYNLVLSTVPMPAKHCMHC